MNNFKNKITLAFVVMALTLCSNSMAKTININGYTRLKPYKLFFPERTDSLYRTQINMYLPEHSTYRKEKARGDFIDASNGIFFGDSEKAEVQFPIKYRASNFLITTGIGSIVVIEKLKESENIDSLKEDWHYLIEKKKGVIISEDKNSISYKLVLKDFFSYDFTRFVKIIVIDDVKLTIEGDYSHFHPGVGDVKKALDLSTKVFQKITIEK